MKAAGVLALLVGASMVAATAQADPLERTFSGWTVATEIDTNQDGVRASSGTVEGKGTFGRSTANDQSELLPGPTGLCSLDPLTLEYQYASSSSVQVFAGGDLLLAALDPDPSNPSTICLDPTLFTSTFRINYVILGGTGRFERATGWITVTGDAIPMAGEPDVRLTHNAIHGSAQGEVFLAE
jgi:hypothetical protein